MNYFKHIGIYVKDIELMSNFYKTVFNMVSICEKSPDEGILYNQLYGVERGKAVITKLVTEYGKISGKGDMIELIYCPLNKEKTVLSRKCYEIGCSHIAIGVDDIEKVVNNILKLGGKKLTDIITIAERKCCFCIDLEGNALELLQ